MKKLTEEQKKLVEENHNLIYSFLYRYHYNIEEYYDIAAIGLCNAAINFDPDKGVTFSTYAYKAMHTQILNLKRQENAQKIIPSYSIISYDTEPNNEEGEGYSYLDIIPSKTNVEEDTLLNMHFSDCIQKVKQEKDKKILKLLNIGYTQKEIAKIIGCSQVCVSRVRKRFGKYWK